ncbi:DUF2249 domain-containing protein [Mucilaginibacter ginsenosidivorans]|uniref:DUF2249 domain-containing protein n=1 Tax=Mucilaginibacter ginsenosidivorans TaxID=398053 RepID=A0A5B8UTU0_9SPHI|nr:DUF2249 domain-containing protein [Mucilaginibacter ginsenosidivorans]QEC62339.1 DUF2249 domain-containing protein [Mucilaginibacter ginsenosidivorans]HVW95932.1 DUF2249 domain-containing protein [Mucilaginibacter sp.]
MNPINANTKIAEVIKQNPDALEAIVSIRPKFEKLRNPLLRRLMAGRTSLAMAAKLGGCSIDDFFVKLEPLGFKIDRSVLPVHADLEPVPDFIHSLRKGQIVDLDVRPILAAGNDPLNTILEHIKNIQPGQVLKVTNTFSPTPLIALLEKKKFLSYTHTAEENQIETYFFKTPETAEVEPELEIQQDWDVILKRYQGKFILLDVRQLEMPLPMTTILEELDKLPVVNALYVYHKRIPVFLLPELTQRNFDYRIREVADGEVHLIIFIP